MSRDRLARIERIEAAIAAPVIAGPLSRHERAELLELEQARQARFPGDPSQWDRERLADFMSWSAGDGHGSAQRLDQLRQRARPPEELAAERALEMAIGTMTADQLDEFMDQHPELWALHHQGLNEAPEPTVDPGEILNRRAYALQASGHARSFAEAVEIAMRQLPEEAVAYNAGLRLPTGQVRQNAEPVPRRRSSDPGIELLHLVEEKISANPTLSIAAAQRAVLAADPALVRHYSEGTLLPMTRPTPVTEQMVAEALLEHRRLTAEIARLQGAGGGTTTTIRHFNDLSEAEKNRTPLRQQRQRERRLRPGEKLQAGETVVHKMAEEAMAGGRFAFIAA